MVTIEGLDFGAESTANYVTYNGNKVGHTSWFATQVKVLMSSYSSVDVQKFRVVVGSITSNTTANSTGSLKIYGISPNSGNIGTVVTISGQGFGSSQVSGAYVTFYDLSQPSVYAIAPVSTWNDTAITCTIPTNLQVTQSGSVGFTVWKSSSIYANGTSFNLAVPAISYINPATDNISATISIYGSGFGTAQGTGYVRIGGNYATVVNWLDNEIRARVPDFTAAGAKAIDLTINNRTITNNNFSVSGPIVTQSYYPAGQSKIGQGETFTIYGSHFGSATDFDGSTSITRSIQVSTDQLYTVNSVSWSDTQITFTWPVPNTLLSNKTANVTINIGGLSTTITNVQAD